MPHGLTLKPEHPLYSLIHDHPDFKFNPIGAKARRVLVNKLKENLLGRYNEPCFMNSIPFQSIFYPYYTEVEHQKKVTQVTELSDLFWANFSISVLCQSIHYHTSEAKISLDIEKIESDVADSNRVLLFKAHAWYAYVLFHDFMHFSSATSTARTREDYLEHINSATWVNYKMKCYANGSWENPAWEMYHHYAKLMALGVPVAEVNDLICSLQQKGLKIPGNVGVDSWMSYMAWCRPPKITHRDVDKAVKAGALKMGCIANPRGFSNLGENFSFDFISAGQPGSKYCKSTSLSCYASNTLVLMADDTLKSIQEIKLGDLLMTPQGVRKVMLVSTRKRNKRDLYRINGLSFHFTATHPIVSATMTPKLLSTSPLDLLCDVPLIGQDGIGLLETGSFVMGYDLQYKKRYSVKVESVEKIPANDKEDELLYDLILEPDLSGKFEYIVSCEDFLLVTTSEVSTLDNHTTFECMAFDVVAGMIARASKQLEDLYKSSDEITFSSTLCNFSRKLKAFLPISAAHVQYKDWNTELPDSLPLCERIISVARFYNKLDQTVNCVLDCAYNYFMHRMYGQVCSILTLGHRTISDEVGVEYLAIAIFDFHITSSSLRIPPNPIIIVQVRSVNAKMETIPDKALMYGKKINHTIFISLKEMEPDEGTPIMIKICDPKSDKVLLTTKLCLEACQSQVSMYHHLRLCDQNMVEQGYINVDIRLLPGGHEQNEENLARMYDTRKQVLLANHLQNEAGTYLAALCKAYSLKETKHVIGENKDDDSDSDTDKGMEDHYSEDKLEHSRYLVKHMKPFHGHIVSGNI